MSGLVALSAGLDLLGLYIRSQPTLNKAPEDFSLDTVVLGAKFINVALDIGEGFIDTLVGIGAEKPTNDHPLGPDTVSHILNSFWRFPEMGLAPFYLAHLTFRVFEGKHILTLKKIHCKHRALFILIRFYVFMGMCQSKSKRRRIKVFEKGLLLPLIDFFRVSLEKCMLEKEQSRASLNQLSSLQTAYVACTSARLLTTLGVIEKCAGIFFDEEEVPDPAYANWQPPPPSNVVYVHVWH